MCRFSFVAKAEYKATEKHFKAEAVLSNAAIRNPLGIDGFTITPTKIGVDVWKTNSKYTMAAEGTAELDFSGLFDDDMKDVLSFLKIKGTLGFIWTQGDSKGLRLYAKSTFPKIGGDSVVTLSDWHLKLGKAQLLAPLPCNYVLLECECPCECQFAVRKQFLGWHCLNTPCAQVLQEKEINSQN